MQEKELLVVILLMMAVTYLARVFPMIIPSKYYPTWIKEGLEFLPTSIIAVIVIPDILFRNYQSYFLTPEFLASIIALLVAWYAKSLIMTVVVSLTALYLLNMI